MVLVKVSYNEYGQCHNDVLSEIFQFDLPRPKYAPMYYLYWNERSIFFPQGYLFLHHKTPFDFLEPENQIELCLYQYFCTYS